jgi:hypothetical protein
MKKYSRKIEENRAEVWMGKNPARAASALQKRNSTEAHAKHTTLLRNIEQNISSDSSRYSLQHMAIYV